VFASYLIRVRVGDSAEPRFVSHFFKTPMYWAQITRSARGVAQPGVNATTLKSLQIPLPPLAEQRRIAEVLDRAEALRAKRRAALAQLDSLTQSIFLDLFGDVVKNNRNWPSERMEDLMKIRRGGSPRPIENYLGGDINWIKIGDGTQGSDIYLERCADKITRDGLKKTVFLKAGSLIFANCGVSLGFARILKIDGCIHDGWLSFEEIPEDKLDKLFLLKALNSITEHFRRIAPSGTQPNLNTGLMKNFRIILPSIELQREFARRLVAVEKLKTSQRASLAELDALFATLQHRAFRGEL
jgi:type I restriction enzyme S subunit